MDFCTPELQTYPSLKISAPRTTDQSPVPAFSHTIFSNAVFSSEGRLSRFPADHLLSLDGLEMQRSESAEFNKIFRKRESLVTQCSFLPEAHMSDHFREGILVEDLFSFDKHCVSPNLSNSNSKLTSPHPELLSIFCEDDKEFTPNLEGQLIEPLPHVFEEAEACIPISNIENIKNLFTVNRESVRESTQLARPRESGKGCNCKKSMCLKLYCNCFSSGTGCGPECSCLDCLNNDSNPLLRQLFMQEMSDGLGTKESSQKDGLVEFPAPAPEIIYGCSCKKTGCSKKYCECFKFGQSCGPNCKCSGCQNPANEPGHQQCAVAKGTTKVIKKQKKKSLSFNSFVEKLKLFHLLNGKATNS